MTTGHDIRQKFLDYFAKHNHRIVKSSPVLPPDDTLLFTNAGMNQFKDVFLGLDKREYSRATTSQKCIRAGGKQNDLEEVGKTARHHTFFEMLGNFSFGDYFKEGAIAFAWELLLKEFALDLDRLWFTVYDDDDEAFDLWKKVGAPADRILRFGKKDNFWQMGDTGPCGPCSEIHYFLGDSKDDNRAEFVNGPGDTIMEIWNLVFMQFDRSEDGTLTPLPKPSVDTGAGLERVTSVLQGKKTNYETDLIRPIIDFIADLSGKEYVYNGDDDNVSMRVIADHARTTAFCLADGIYPGNTGRNYVLRKIMRRAIWHGKRLGMQDAFFHKVTNFVIDHMAGPFPELRTQAAEVVRGALTEERLFTSVLTNGQRRLEDSLTRASAGVISGVDAFDLYQTYGLPLDFITFVAEQRKMEVDTDGFEAALAEERRRARESWKGAAKHLKPVYQEILNVGPTVFTGYEGTALPETRVRAVLLGDEAVEVLQAGQEGEVVLDRTPFYAESGGQVGDTGVIDSDAVVLRVTDTYAPVAGLTVHKVTVERGAVHPGDLVSASVDAVRRQRTVLNHTATHLMHAALREVLGTHVKQAGSIVAPDKLRFDFTHYAALTAEEIAEIERLVNAQIRRNEDVHKNEMDLETAVAGGAMALFGEKYASRVRVVDVPGFSKELCGGTHANATGDIGLFKIVSETAISAGTRRIVAVTGEDAFAKFQQDEHVLATLADTFKTAVPELPAQVDKLQQALRQSEREMESLRLKLARLSAANALDSAREVGGVKVVSHEVENLDKSGMRSLADGLVQKLGSGVVVLGQREGEKVSLLVRVSDDLTKRVQAGKIVKELAAIVGGGGGGKPDLAEAGGRDATKLDEALAAAAGAVEKLL
ncbi:MAG: alanine--tRNA ligase [Blastocatellia bacterium]|nr:alanine--tRNA ligase [Blastocatellia bacterium]